MSDKTFEIEFVSPDDKSVQLQATVGELTESDNFFVSNVHAVSGTEPLTHLNLYIERVAVDGLVSWRTMNTHLRTEMVDHIGHAIQKKKNLEKVGDFSTNTSFDNTAQ